VDVYPEPAIPHTEIQEGLALYVHLHPALFGLLIYDHRQQQIKDMDCRILHSDEHPPVQRNGMAVIDRQILRDWMKDHAAILNRNYDKVAVCVSTPVFQLLDNEELASDEVFSIMNSAEAASIVTRTDRIRNDLYVQFAIEKQLDQLLTSHFEPGSIHFGERGLLQLLSSESDLFTDGLYCHILGQEAAVFILSGSRLIFFNKYMVRNREDLLYYILLCYQEHGMDPGENPLYLGGLIDKPSPMFDLIFDYIRHVDFMSIPGNIELPDDRPGEFMEHHYINLLSIR
jgi:hypothetical protein